jgi:hypothetical protein
VRRTARVDHPRLGEVDPLGDMSGGTHPGDTTRQSDGAGVGSVAPCLLSGSPVSPTGRNRGRMLSRRRLRPTLSQALQRPQAIGAAHQLTRGGEWPLALPETNPEQGRARWAAPAEPHWYDHVTELATFMGASIGKTAQDRRAKCCHAVRHGANALVVG